MDDRVEWLRAQYDEDERWARAASQAYPYAKPPAVPPPTGVRWRWVAGDDWHTVTPDPVIDEFVVEPGCSCNLATVEEWSSGDRTMPRTYANDIVEMDSAAAGHIIRHDPARVLREVEAKRRILDLHSPSNVDTYSARLRLVAHVQCAHCAELCHSRSGLGCDEPADALYPCDTVRLLLLPYSDRPGYRQEWRP